MGMGSLGGSRAKVQPEMNVTPLVDVVLVLLIIFMVLAPVVTAGFNVRLPPKDDKDKALDAANDPTQPLILHVDDKGGIEVNSVALEPSEASARIRRMFNAREDRVLYLDGADEAPYGGVLRAVDLARQGGAHPVVMLTQRLDK